MLGCSLEPAPDLAAPRTFDAEFFTTEATTQSEEDTLTPSDLPDLGGELDAEAALEQLDEALDEALDEMIELLADGPPLPEHEPGEPMPNGAAECACEPLPATLEHLDLALLEGGPGVPALDEDDTECADAVSTIKGNLKELEDETYDALKIVETLWTQATKAKKLLAKQRQALPKIKDIIDLLANMGLITAEQATQLKQKVDAADAKLGAAEAKLGSAITKAGDAIKKYDEAIILIEQGLAALAKCPPDLMKAWDRHDDACRASDKALAKALEAQKDMNAAREMGLDAFEDIKNVLDAEGNN